jgi:mono/diheme cytochrome c family protein
MRNAAPVLAVAIALLGGGALIDGCYEQPGGVVPPDVRAAEGAARQPVVAQAPAVARPGTVLVNCGPCHTLAAAGASGRIGPNLDEHVPSVAVVEERIRHGGDVMPPFGDLLSDDEIHALAAYVVDASAATVSAARR